HARDVNRVAFSPSGKLVASASDDRTVRLWALAGGGERVLRGHRDAVVDVVFSADGRTVATASLDHTVRLWDVESGESRVWRGSSPALQVRFSPDDGQVAAMFADGTVRL